MYLLSDFRPPRQQITLARGAGVDSGDKIWWCPSRPVPSHHVPSLNPPRSIRSLSVGTSWMAI